MINSFLLFMLATNSQSLNEGTAGTWHRTPDLRFKAAVASFTSAVMDWYDLFVYVQQQPSARIPALFAERGIRSHLGPLHVTLPHLPT